MNKFLKPLFLLPILALLNIFSFNNFAFAHAALIKSDPKNESTVTTLPDTAHMLFSENIRKNELRVVALAPDNAEITDGLPLVEGREIKVKIKPTKLNGNYQIRFHILSQDGHPISGKLEFKVNNPHYTNLNQIKPTETPSAINPAENNLKATNKTDYSKIFWVVGISVIVLLAAVYAGNRIFSKKEHK